MRLVGGRGAGGVWGGRLKDEMERSSLSSFGGA